MDEGQVRKIIHIDMDAFYASVEQRDNPSLKGKPVAVGYPARRGVVAAASYEARGFGVRSAMPSTVAIRKCPELVFAPPRFDVYREVSKQVQAIFREYTPLVEPLSLDEAYLDVTDNLKVIPTAWETAKEIRARIYEETRLTASAGISCNKLLAKLASDYRKPNGQFAIMPDQAEAFVATLAVAKFHGVGPQRLRSRCARLALKRARICDGKPLLFCSSTLARREAGTTTLREVGTTAWFNPTENESLPDPRRLFRRT
jgi:DNA polymerase IV